MTVAADNGPRVRRGRLAGEDATRHLARRLASIARVPDTILLAGDLGAGKSVFARAFIRAWLGDPEAEVPSPTFTLVQPYEGERGVVWHCDLYRLSDPAEVLELGLDEALAATVCLVEWPDRLGGIRPLNRLEIRLDLCQESEPAEDLRLVTVSGHGDWSGRIAQLPFED